MEDRPKVLVVDDDESIRELIQVYLEDDYQVLHAASGIEAISAIRSEKPVLMILDIMLPGKTGWEVCKEARSFSNIPIIMVTAKGEEVDRILGLELGADDYICKPFSPRELLARVKAQIRRSSLTIEPLYSGPDKTNLYKAYQGKPDQEKNNPEKPDEAISIPSDAVIEVYDFIIDCKKYKATLKGHYMDLTAREFLILAFLVKHEGQVFNREQLLESIWGFDFAGNSRAVDSAIKRLRKKLNDIDSETEFIHSVRSIGYKFEVSG